MAANQFQIRHLIGRTPVLPFPDIAIWAGTAGMHRAVSLIRMDALLLGKI
jgi:hypothetical protein